VRSFADIKNLSNELGSTLQSVKMERRQRIIAATEKLRELTEPDLAMRAHILAVPTMLRSTRGNKRMKFVNRDVNAAINFRRSAVLKTRPAEIT